MSELFSTDGAICPYCEKVHTAADTDYAISDEGVTEYECHRCERTFTVSAHLQYSWITKQKPTPRKLKKANLAPPEGQ